MCFENFHLSGNGLKRNFYFSCYYFSTSDDIILATVHEKKLLLSDIQTLLDGFDSKEDSMDFVQNWIESWVKEQLMVQQAQNNLTNQLESVKKQIESYHNYNFTTLKIHLSKLQANLLQEGHIVEQIFFALR